MLTIDLTLELGSATAQIKDDAGSDVGTPVTLSTKPERITLASGQSITVADEGPQPYRLMIVHSGTADSGSIDIDATAGGGPGKYILKPSTTARLGSSVVVETSGQISIILNAV